MIRNLVVLQGFMVLVVAGFLGQNSSAGTNRCYLQSTGRDFKAIVVAENPTGAALLAAEELQRYAAKVTGGTAVETYVEGVRLPILKDSQKEIPKPAILVGASKLTEALGIDFKNLKPEGFILKTTPDYLVIAGDDHPAWTSEILTKKDRVWLGAVEREAGTRVGTLFGVYSFLQDVAGVGWYFGGPLGEVVPTRRDIAVPNLDRTDAPDFGFRVIASQSFFGLPYPYELELNRRFPFRLRLGYASPRWCNHSMYHWGRLFGKDHPEYFELLDGKRTSDWGNTGGNSRDFCWANPATIAQQVEEMRLYFKGEVNRHPWCWISFARDTFPIAGNDCPMKPCECELCHPWVIDPNRDYDGSQSDLYAYHLAEVAKVAAKEFPGNAIIGLAYGPRVRPPAKVTLPANVQMALAFIVPAQMMNSTTQKAYDQLVEAWLGKTTVAMMWLYTDAFRANHPLLPLTIPHAVAREIQQRRGKVGGFFFCHAPSPVYDDLELYVAAQLMWKADQDVNALIAKFMTSLYGPAAEPVRQIYAYLEELWADEMKTDPPRDAEGYGKYEGILQFGWAKKYNSRNYLWKNVFTSDRLLKTLKLIESARKLADAHLNATRDDLPLLRVQRLEEKLKASWAESVRAGYEQAQARQNALTAPALPCPLIKDGAVIDGELKEEAWSRSLTAEMGNILSMGKAPSCKTRLWLWRNDSDLYVGVECSESFMEKLAARASPADPAQTIWSNDEIEIFLDPANSCETYYQIGLDAAGQMAVLRYSSPSNQDKSFVSFPVEAKVARKANCWIVEVRIPFSALGGAPLAGARWGINIIRNRQAKDNSPQELSGWFSNSEGAFHLPGEFGRIRF